MEVLGGMLGLHRGINENRKKRSILSILLVVLRRLPLDGRIDSLLQIWLIITVITRSLEVFKVVGWTIYVVVAV